MITELTTLIFMLIGGILGVGLVYKKGQSSGEQKIKNEQAKTDMKVQEKTHEAVQESRTQSVAPDGSDPWLERLRKHEGRHD